MITSPLTTQSSGSLKKGHDAWALSLWIESESLGVSTKKYTLAEVSQGILNGSQAKSPALGPGRHGGRGSVGSPSGRCHLPALCLFTRSPVVLADDASASPFSSGWRASAHSRSCSLDLEQTGHPSVCNERPLFLGFK